MEQLGSTVPINDTPQAVTEPTTNRDQNNHQLIPQSHPSCRTTATSSSVPSLRFPRPVGNRRLQNWVSSSQPDIMRPSSFPDNVPLDTSITDGYEVIGSDGEAQPDAVDPVYEHTASELGDDVQSLADTDTGTDAYTNDVDTDSSEDEDDDEEDVELDQADEATGGSAVLTDDEDHEIDMSEAERSLEHPTELFTPDTTHLSRRPSISDAEHDPTILQRVTSAAGLSRGHGVDSKEGAGTNIMPNPEFRSKTRNSNGSWTISSVGEMYKQAMEYLQENRSLRERLMRLMLLFPLLFSAILAGHYIKSYLPSQNGVLTTVPVASVSSVATPSDTLALLSTSTVTSTVTSTKVMSLALQTTSNSKSVASISPDSSLLVGHSLCSAKVHSRNEILLGAPQLLKKNWLAKHAIMISVSRNGYDIAPEHTKITAMNEGFIIEVPLEEAYGILDVSIATTRKPKIKETFHVNFGSFVIVDALDAGKQFMKGFAQTVVDTINGTTTWVEETCVPALDLMSKQPGSISDSVLHGFQGATNIARSLPGQIAHLVAQPFPEGRAEQARKELWRTAQDLQDDAELLLLQAQLNSKLQWLRWSGQTAKYEQYLAAAGPYYHMKREKAAIASRARADHTKKELHKSRKSERRQSRFRYLRANNGH